LNYNNSLSLWNFDEYFLKCRVWTSAPKVLIELAKPRQIAGGQLHPRRGMKADRRSIEFAGDGAEQIAQLEQPGSLGMVSMSAMSAADTMRGGAVILPLFLLRPLDRPSISFGSLTPPNRPGSTEVPKLSDLGVTKTRWHVNCHPVLFGMFPICFA
jgi:hypothetical protein